jgi:hypothetical protein
MIDVKGGPDLDGGIVGVAEAGTVLSWGRAGSAYYWRRSKSLINRQLINGAALVGRPCFFFHRAGVPLRRVVLDDHEGGDDRHRCEDEPGEPAAVAARQGVEIEVIALIRHVVPLATGTCRRSAP